MGFTPEQWNELVASLQKYAQLLKQTFEHNLAAINGPGMGIRLEAKLCCSLQIDPHETVKDRARQPDRDEQTIGPHDPLQRSMEDMTFFETWLNQPSAQAKRLLLLAPFGSGKSVMLAQFALVLARSLEEWCDSAAMPPTAPIVPFPVRLRGWGGKRRLWQYMLGTAEEDAQTDLFGERILTAGDMQQLRDHGLLLPILDGFDELPNNPVDSDYSAKNARAALVDEMLAIPSFRNRMILSSRPEHEAESSPYAEDVTIHKLGELDQKKAEEFITGRLAKLTPSLLAEFMQRYRDAQPAINDLFRRPLFLAAWCSKAAAARTVQEIPTTISGLMGVMLEHVLDVRLADYGSGNGTYLSQNKLLKGQYLLGAVLAIHADHGFGVQLPNLIEKRRDSVHGQVFPDEILFERYVQSAIKAGLLLKDGERTFTHKIPIVEYLIGYYYAWLAKSAPEGNQSRPRQLAMLFQKRFWWYDQEEVWRYAFDLMWNGEDAEQHEIAKHFTRWILNLSKHSIAAANWEGPLSENQDPADRAPIHWFTFALRVLLPTVSQTAAVTNILDELVEEGFRQMNECAVRNWRILGRTADLSTTLPRSRMKRIEGWLFECLVSKDFTDVQEHISGQMLTLWKDLAPNTINCLALCLIKREHRRVLNEIGDLVRDRADDLNAETVQTLLHQLPMEEDSAVCFAVSQILAKLTGKLDLSVLRKWLRNKANEHIWPSVIYILSNATHELESHDIDLLLQRLGEIRPEDLVGCWEMASLGLSLVVEKFHSNFICQLLKYLRRPRLSGAYKRIAELFARAAVRLEPKAFDELLEELSQDRYKKARCHLGDSFYLCRGSLGLSNSAFGRTLYHLGEQRDERLTELIDEYIGSTQQDVCPLVQLDMESFSRYLQLVGKEEVYFQGRAIHPTISQLVSLRRALQRAITYTVSRQVIKDEAIALAKCAADRAARRGCRTYARLIAKAIPSLILFVRDIDSSAIAGLKIVYGVAERNDADLLLPADKRFVPFEIRRLLGTLTIAEQNRAAGINADWQRSEVAIDLVVRAVEQHRKTAEVKAFKQALGSKSRAYEKLEDPILPLVKRALGVDEVTDLWILKERDTKRSGKNSSAMPADNNGKRNGRQLRVDMSVLKHLLEDQYANAVSDIYHAVLARRELKKKSWLKFTTPVVICSLCGHIHLLPKPPLAASDNAKPTGPAKKRKIMQPVIGTCKVCKRQMRTPEEATEHPVPYGRCPNPNCRATYKLESEEGGWECRPKAEKCFRDNAACQEGPLHRIEVHPASRHLKRPQTTR